MNTIPLLKQTLSERSKNFILVLYVTAVSNFCLKVLLISSTFNIPSLTLTTRELNQRHSTARVCCAAAFACEKIERTSIYCVLSNRTGPRQIEILPPKNLFFFYRLLGRFLCHESCPQPIGYFRVALNLIMKARLTAKLFL